MSFAKKTVSLLCVALLVIVVADAFKGQATYYDPGVGTTACGSNHKSSDLIAALNAPQFDPKTPNGNPNRNTLCNRLVKVTGPKGSVTVKIVDKCPGCKTGSLDLSPAAFKRINGNSLTAGRVGITWTWA